MRYKLFLGFIAFFLISLTFPIIASISSLSLGSLAEYADVTVALVLVGLSLLIHLRKKKKLIGSRRKLIGIFKMLMASPLLLIVLYLTGVQIRWDVLLIGLAWRIWLLSLTLEDLVDIYKRSSRNVVNDRVHYQ